MLGQKDGSKSRLYYKNHTVKPLHISHLGDRRKWLLKRGGHCRGSNRSQCMDYLSTDEWNKRSCCREGGGRGCGEVAIRGGSTVFLSLHQLVRDIFRRHALPFQAVKIGFV